MDSAASQVLRQHSEKLIQQIAENIQANGPMPFDQYMEMALYAPGLGYYSAGMHKFGAQGDFVTAPEVSPVFGACLANQVQQVFQTLAVDEILEFGAGTGKLAGDILLSLQGLGCLPSAYYILEVSADLRQRQQQHLTQQVPELFDRVVWLDHLPNSFSGVVIANEVLDAMPVSRFRLQEDVCQEQFVELADDGLRLVWRDAVSAGLEQAIDKQVPNQDQLPKPYESEINLRLDGWLTGLFSMMDKGLVLLIDYGYPAREYYHPQRHMGSLTCYHRHSTNNDPLWYPGVQDITAHVDFSAVANAAHQAGFNIAGFSSQMMFLLSNGLDRVVAYCMAENPDDINLMQGVKTLTLPTAMGERFQVIGLSKGNDMVVQGFQMRNMLERL